MTETSPQNALLDNPKRTVGIERIPAKRNTECKDLLVDTVEHDEHVKIMIYAEPSTTSRQLHGIIKPAAKRACRATFGRWREDKFDLIYIDQHQLGQKILIEADGRSDEFHSLQIAIKPPYASMYDLEKVHDTFTRHLREAL